MSEDHRSPADTVPEAGPNEEIISERIENKVTLYRYRDKETTTSYDPYLSGWTQDGNPELINQGQKSIDYTVKWPGGFDTSHKLYTKYNNSKVSPCHDSTLRDVE